MVPDELSNNSFASVHPSEEDVQRFRELLLNGDIDEADELRCKCKDITESVAAFHAREAYNLHKDLEQYLTAVKIAALFKLGETDSMAVKVAEWNRLNRKQEYEQAAEWAKQQGLTDIEMVRSAKMAYEQAIKENRAYDALRIMTRYNLQKEDLLSMTISEFNRAYSEGDYYSAALLGKQFSFSLTRTIQAAVKAVQEFLTVGDREKAYSIIEQFKLISDEMIEQMPEREAIKFVEQVRDKFINFAFDQGNYQLMQEFKEATKITIIPFNNHFLKELVLDFYKAAIRSHNELLKKGEVRTARSVRDSFDLFAAPIPFELYATMLLAAEGYHETLLNGNDLNDAINFKKEYGLFDKFVLETSHENLLQQVSQFVSASLEKGQIKPALLAIKEYALPKEYINKSVFLAVLELLSNEQFKDTGTIYAEFKAELPQEENRIQAVNAYKDLMQKKQYIPALEFAKWCRLQKSFVDDAAVKAWQVEFLARRYDEALAIKDHHKVPQSAIRPLARKAYQEYLTRKDYKMAVYIRKTYKVHIGLTEWLIEFFRILFSK